MRICLMIVMCCISSRLCSVYEKERSSSDNFSEIVLQLTSSAAPHYQATSNRAVSLIRSDSSTTARRFQNRKALLWYKLKHWLTCTSTEIETDWYEEEFLEENLEDAVEVD